MVNMQPGGQGEQQWSPRLPEGYEGNGARYVKAMRNDSWSPGMGCLDRGMQGFPPGQGMTGYDMQGFSPEQGMKDTICKVSLLGKG